MFEELSSVTFVFQEYGPVTLSIESMMVNNDEYIGEVMCQVPVFTDSNTSYMVFDMHSVSKLLENPVTESIMAWLTMKREDKQ
jgi:hypothetical protein